MKAWVDGFSEPVVAPDLTDERWFDLRTRSSRLSRQRAKGKSRLCICLDCGQPLHPKSYDATKTRFFAHNPGSLVYCALSASETPEHHRLKTAIYLAANRVPGWKADVEVPTGDPDPYTGKPVVVDVVATREGGPPADKASRLGWEIQLSAMNQGEALDRQESRERYLERCVWVTETDVSWRDQVPWYQVRAQTAEHADLVVAGVVTRHDWGEGRGSDYLPVQPFKADAMVPLIMRGRTIWIEDIGWTVDGSPDGLAVKRGRGKRPPRASARVAEWCTRQVDIPAVARAWSEDDWFRHARVAHQHRLDGDALSPLDHAALLRFPVLDELEVDLATFERFPDYDHLSNTLPCIHCGQLVEVSVSADFPLHHRCRWHLERS